MRGGECGAGWCRGEFPSGGACKSEHGHSGFGVTRLGLYVDHNSFIKNISLKALSIEAEIELVGNYSAVE